MTGTEAALSRSEEETERLGEDLAPLLGVGDLVSLEGPLGAGKTRFVVGLARGLAAQARVRSPSFTLVNEYPGRVTLFHLDLYRLEGADADGLGFEDYLDRGALVVEWGEKLPSGLRSDALHLTFEPTAPTERRVTSHATGARARALLTAWRARAEAR